MPGFSLRRSILAAVGLLVATTLAHGFLLFQPHFDSDLMIGEWRGTFTYPDGEESYTWNSTYDEDGTLTVHFVSYINGEEVESYTHHGRWSSDGYLYESFIEEISYSPGERVPEYYEFSYHHIELTEDTHVYESIPDGRTFTARRVN